jgi:hypothetical protein
MTEQQDAYALINKLRADQVIGESQFMTIYMALEAAPPSVEALQEELAVRNEDVEREVHIGNEYLARIATLEATNAAQAEQLAEAHAAMQEFVDRCDAGEARSSYTYAKFKALLQSIPPEPQATVELTDEEIIRIAAESGVCQTNQVDMFSAHKENLIEFARALNQRQAVKTEPVAYGLFWKNHEGKEVLQFPVAGLEDGCKDDLKHYSPEVQKQMTIRPLYTEPLSAAQGVPEGMVLVPKEPTEAMLHAARFYDKELPYTLATCYRAMLSAAPEQAESKEGKL